jgi:hypothetical protein
MACYLDPNVSSSIDNSLLTYAGYNKSPNVDHFKPLHEGGDLGNLNFIGIDE